VVLGSPRCPVASLEKYLSKLNPNSECFWQRPKRQVKDGGSFWYDSIAVGHNTLGNFMKTISTKAELSQIYTNHCIRATCITALDNKGMEARHIMSISGHKSETSIKSYSRNVSEKKKHEMCAVLQNIVQQPNTEQPPTTTSLPVEETNKAGSPDNFNINQVQDYEVQELNDGQFLSELTSMMEVPDEHEKENNSNKKNSSASQIGPMFQNVKLVQIHYHINKN